MSDPEELPGLAHFCEHMLFYSSEKFPEEDAYSKFIVRHLTPPQHHILIANQKAKYCPDFANNAGNQRQAIRLCYFQYLALLEINKGLTMRM